MAASIAGLRRNLKNVAHNYTDAQVKVREATSNDPWGPSSTQMSEIADLTYNVIAFSEIMQMIWKRINDSGKNWRHVYKALVLLEYLIKTGSEKVAQQCRENIFSIQTLKDFQFLEENKDQGLNVREKAKSLVSLLKDEEKLKNERVRALKAKERFAQSTAGLGSDTAFGGGGGGGMDPHNSSPMGSPPHDRMRPDLELASYRPQTQGEEELQLQLALAMSREEAEAEETKKKSDEMRLTLAIQKSKEEADKGQGVAGGVPSATGGGGGGGGGGGSALNDLVDLNFGHPAPPLRTTASLDPWGSSTPAVAPSNNDPWGGGGGGNGGAESAWSQPAAQATSPIPMAAGGFHASPVRGPPPAADPWNPQGVSGGAGLSDPWGAPAPTSPARYQADQQDPFSPQGGGNTADLLAAFGGGGGGGGGGGASAVDSAFGGMGGVGGGGLAPTAAGGNPWDLSTLDPHPANSSSDLLSGGMNTGARPKKTVESLLGEHSNLVNLDDLVQAKANPSSAAKNPFADQPNPFQAAAAPKPTINQLRTGGQNGSSSSPWPEQGQPTNNQDINPFF